ncbi:MAG: hypothetical protein KatS3mg079_100 [Caloramator sp.]|nr:MAG: hypothetical protein KatS3mg079_100 [Caloramator sp.]
MQTVEVKQLYRESEKYLNQDVRVSGWVRTVRSSKAFGFIELNDGTFFKNLQIVFDEKLENFKEVEKLPISSSITVEGRLVETPGAKQPFEVHAD